MLDNSKDVGTTEGLLLLLLQHMCCWCDDRTVFPRRDRLLLVYRNRFFRGLNLRLVN